MNIVPLVYDYAQSWPQKRYDYISPSSLGGCMRAHYYKLKGVPMTTPPNPGALLNFELGRLWETPVENALKHSGVGFMSQLYLKDETLHMAGTLDIAIYDREQAMFELVSIKTEGAMKAKYRAKDGQNFFQANPEYAIQEACYYLLMEANGYPVSDRARYLVITKDNGWLEEPVLKISPQLLEHTLARIYDLRDALSYDKLPDCDCKGWKVGYCNYGDPKTREKNKTGKEVNVSCCDENLIKEVQDVSETKA